MLCIRSGRLAIATHVVKPNPKSTSYVPILSWLRSPGYDVFCNTNNREVGVLLSSDSIKTLACFALQTLFGRTCTQGLRIKCGVVKDMEEVLRIEGTFHSLALGTAFDGGVLAQHADD